MGSSSWLRCFLIVIGALALYGNTAASAQEEAEPVPEQEEPEVEIITEPPASTEPPEMDESEPAPITEPPPSELPPPVVTSPTELPEVDKRKERIGMLRVGGGLGFGFATDLIFLSIEPQVSYLIKKIVEPGVSLVYQYTKDRFPDPDRTWHNFGGRLFVRLYPIQTLFFLVEGELLNVGFTQGAFKSGRTNYGNLFLGGGYVMGVGKGAFVAVSLKFNVFRNAFYPSILPIFSIGGGYAF